MKVRPRFLFQISISALLLVGGAGCSILPKASVDETRFYVLTTSASGASSQANGPSLLVRPIELATYLRGRPLIFRRGDNEIEFREYARWGEPLDLGIARVLREELATRGGVNAMLSTSGRRERVTPDYELVVRVQAAEGNASGTVEFRASWSVTKSGAKNIAQGSGEFRATDLRWDGKTEGSLATQLSAAVSALAVEVSGALKK